MSNMRRVAEAAGVSVMTVSRYFSQPDILAERTRLRVERAIRDLKYVPNEMARSLVRGHSDTVGLLVTDVTNPYFTTLTRGVEDAVHAAGKTLILGNTDETAERERRYLDVMISRRVDGMILAPATADPDHVGMLRTHGIPLVLVDRTVPGLRLDAVRSDGFAGARTLTEYLISKGHRRIAFVGGRPGLSSLEERLSGYEATMLGHGLEPIVRLGRFDRASGEEVVNDLFTGETPEGDTHPTALVAANNYVAVGAVSRLRELSLHVPEDVSIVSFDDFEVEALVDPFFTIVKQPAYEIGRVAAEMLLKRLDGDDAPPRDEMLPVSFIERHSVLAREP